MISQMLIPSLKTQQGELPQTIVLLNSIKAVLEKGYELWISKDAEPFLPFFPL